VEVIRDDDLDGCENVTGEATALLGPRRDLDAGRGVEDHGRRHKGQTSPSSRASVR
jgi:hypothetical protein